VLTFREEMFSCGWLKIIEIVQADFLLYTLSNTNGPSWHQT